MAEPLVIEVTRGGRVESRHAVHVAVVDAEGRAVWTRGEADRAIFPRSAIKVFQAVPLIESGAADAYGFQARELSLACASHSGEADHRALAADMLERGGLGEADLECGCHWPFDLSQALHLARDGGQPSPLGNNCSGKHAGFLCTAVHLGEAPAGYVEAGHPVQARVRAVIEDLTGCRLGDAERGIDGCSIPTWAAPLDRYALGFARLAAGRNVASDRAAAGRRLMEACMAEPWFMAGTGRACVALMQAAPGRVFAKTGAEGVFCGAVPELGLGFALKVEDGATRAAEIATAVLLAELFRASDPMLAERYESQAERPLTTWRKHPTGAIRAAADGR